MSARSVWLGLAESASVPLPALTAWRDSVAAAHAALMPGVEGLRRYTAFNISRTLLVADISGRLDPDGPPIRAPDGIAFTSLTAIRQSEFRQPGVGDPLSAPLLYSVLFSVPPHWWAPFDEWYETEHIPMILECEHWAMTRRCRLTPDTSVRWTHLAIHYVMDARAFDSPALKAARLTPWRAKFLEQDWFTSPDKAIYFQQTADGNLAAHTARAAPTKSAAVSA